MSTARKIYPTEPYRDGPGSQRPGPRSPRRSPVGVPANDNPRRLRPPANDNPVPRPPSPRTTVKKGLGRTILKRVPYIGYALTLYELYDYMRTLNTYPDDYLDPGIWSLLFQCSQPVGGNGSPHHVASYNGQSVCTLNQGLGSHIWGEPWTTSAQYIIRLIPYDIPGGERGQIYQTWGRPKPPTLAEVPQVVPGSKTLPAPDGVPMPPVLPPALQPVVNPFNPVTVPFTVVPHIPTNTGWPQGRTSGNTAPGTGVQPLAPPNGQPPGPGTRERKVRVARAIYQVINFATESVDWVNAFYFALPREYWSRYDSVADKARKVYEHYDELDSNRLFENIIYMELQDRAIGMLSPSQRRWARTVMEGMVGWEAGPAL